MKPQSTLQTFRKLRTGSLKLLHHAYVLTMPTFNCIPPQTTDISHVNFRPKCSRAQPPLLLTIKYVVVILLLIPTTDNRAYVLSISLPFECPARHTREIMVCMQGQFQKNLMGSFCGRTRVCHIPKPLPCD